MRSLLRPSLCLPVVHILIALTSGMRSPAAFAQDASIFEHLHAFTETQWSAELPNPATGQLPTATAETHMQATLASMDEFSATSSTTMRPDSSA